MSIPSDFERLKVFISYSRKDSAFAEDLLLALEAAGFDPYLDKHDIVPGEPWEERLDRLIQAADTVVFIISPNSIRSERVEWEINRTEDLGKRIIPVVWREVAEADTPVRLRRLNYVFFSGEDRSFGRGLSELAKALKTDLDWIRAHTAYSEQAVRWKSKGQPESLLLRGDAIIEAKAWMGRRPNNAPEPTLVQREFIGESETAEQARKAFEKAQAEAMKNAELDKLKALQESDKLRLEVLERQRRMSRLMFAGLVGLSLLGGGIGWRELRNSEERRIAAEELNRREQQIKEYEQQLAQLTQSIGSATASKGLADGVIKGIDDGVNKGRDIVKSEQTDTKAPSKRFVPLTPEEVRTLISPDAAALMVAYEVGSQSDYEKRFARPVWPGLSSGVVIGIGYDLGYHTVEDVRATWGPHLPAGDLDRLAAVVGKKGEAAKEALASVSDIRVPWEAAFGVFNDQTLAKFGGMVLANFPNAHELPPDSFGALVSLVYNRGTSFEGDKTCPHAQHPRPDGRAQVRARARTVSGYEEPLACHYGRACTRVAMRRLPCSRRVSWKPPMPRHARPAGNSRAKPDRNPAQPAGQLPPGPICSLKRSNATKPPRLGAPCRGNPPSRPHARATEDCDHCCISGPCRRLGGRGQKACARV